MPPSFDSISVLEAAYSLGGSDLHWLDGVSHALSPLLDHGCGVAAFTGHVAAGHSHAAIARLRGVSRHTVANQLAEVYRRLELGGRSDLVGFLAGRGRRG
jgi:hypothetical protein